MPYKINPPSISPPHLAAAIVFVIMMAKVIHLYLSPEAALVQAIPDDAFYYLMLAKHRAHDGFWTFDGDSPATGFHLLYGYLLLAMHKAFHDPDLRCIFIITSTLATISISIAAYICCKVAISTFNKGASISSTIPFLTIASINQSTSMMESWIVIPLASATIMLATKRNNATRAQSVGLIILGILGSLARSDYGLLPAAMTVVSSTARSAPIYFKRSALIFAGATLGVLIVILHNYHVSGGLIQASAAIKLHWSEISGHSINPPIGLALTVILPAIFSLSDQLQTIVCMLIIATILFCAHKSLNERNQASNRYVALTSSIATIFGYILIYSHNSKSLQPWYASNLIAPTSIIFSAIFFYASEKRSHIISTLIFIAYTLDTRAGLNAETWPHQKGMMTAGIYIRNAHPNIIFGSWNAGIISYFSRRKIINIDGLTNDDAVPFIKSNSLIDYIADKKISYIVDYEAMLKNPTYKTRGGYNDSRTQRCIRAIKAIDGNSPQWENTRVKIFKVDQKCLIKISNKHDQ